MNFYYEKYARGRSKITKSTMSNNAYYFSITDHDTSACRKLVNYIKNLTQFYDETITSNCKIHPYGSSISVTVNYTEESNIDSFILYLSNKLDELKIRMC